MSATSQDPALGAPPTGSEFDRLNAASVALLDPLFDPAARGDPATLAGRLGQAILECAHTAESLGLRSLNYLAALLVPHLQRQAGGPGWNEACERAEAWIGDVVAFCAGHTSPGESVRLLSALLDWPGFPAIPEQFVLLIGGRLRQDAAAIQQLAARQLSPVPPAAPAVATAEPADETADAVHQAAAVEPQPLARLPETAESAAAQGAAEPPGDLEAREAAEAASVAAAGSAPEPRLRRLDVPDEDVAAARDEFDMLAEAVDGLADELRAQVDEQTAEILDAGELVDLVLDRLGHLASALQFMQVPPLEAVIALAVENVSTWISEGRGLDGAHLGVLREFLALLGAYLRGPGEESALGLALSLADPAWPQVPEPDELEPLARRLAAVSLVRSRQVERRRGALDASDLALDVPSDADPRVVDNLLRELPQLSAEFAACIDRLAAGTLAEVEPAQRIAHTLKGSANTVGVRGIATLTHQLEDLLQLMARESAFSDSDRAGLLEVLVRAADCLGEMTDAVAGLGPEPLDAMVVCRDIGGWIDRLLGEDEAAAEAAGVPDAAADEAGAESGHLGAETACLPAETAPDARAEAEAEVVPGEGTRADAQVATDEELMRVPGRLVDRMLDLAAEASILLSQVQEQVALLGGTRASLRLGTERLGELSNDLERLVDVRGVSLTGRRSRRDFDALEFDDFDDLHTVSRRIAESSADEKLIEQQLDHHAYALAESVGHLERVQTDLREAVMHSRMMAVSSIAPRLQRVVRQAARMTGRRIELKITGEQTAVDAQLLQRVVDPVAHLLRNAVDHGIEPEERRIVAGKPPVGRIELRFEREGALLRVRCIDDGAGLDIAVIRRKALAQGLIREGDVLSDAQVARLILLPGFSTRETATQVSGRGVGLDVVNRAVQGLRGTVDIESRPGQGTTVTLGFAERLATTAVAVSRTPSHVLALSVRGVERVLAADGLASDEQGELRFVLEDGFVPAVRLDVAIGLPAGFFEREFELAQRAGPSRGAAVAAEVVLLVKLDDGRRIALVAPDLGQTRSVVVRPFPSWLPRRRAIEGAAVLGDGAVAPVIDLPALLAGGDLFQAPAVELPTPARAAPVCLVVDDSVSVRRSMQTFLQDLGFEVDAAGDGLEALAVVERRVPDVAIVDLEMPRMNGLEFAAALRASERTVEVPVIMITSRYSERHRAMALDAGVDVFLTKPYTEDELAAHVRRCLERGAALG